MVVFSTYSSKLLKVADNSRPSSVAYRVQPGLGFVAGRGGQSYMCIALLQNFPRQKGRTRASERADRTSSVSRGRDLPVSLGRQN